MINELYEELVRSEEFPKAYKVACFPNTGKLSSAVHDMSMVDDLLQQPKLPALLRAEILQWKGTLALQSGDRDGWLSLTGEASRIFQAEGHRSGPLSIEMERLHKDPDKTTQLPYDELKAATVRIRDEFIELGNWMGAKDCMLNLATMAISHADEELLGQLNDQYERIRADIMTTIEWTDKEDLLLQYWGSQKQHVAKMLPALEDLYKRYVDGGMPSRGALVAFSIFKAYEGIGDRRNAQKWVGRAAEHAGSDILLPLHFFHPFLLRLEEAKAGIGILPVEAEAEQLSDFLADKKARYAENISRFERTQIAQSIFRAEAAYLHRPFEECKTLSSMCFEAVRALLPQLPAHDRAISEASLLERMAGVFFTEAMQQPPPSRGPLVDAYNSRAEAAGILESVCVRGFQLSGIYGGLGEAAEWLWTIESAAAGKGSIQDSLFQEAEHFYRNALTIAAEEKLLTSTQLAVTRLHDLWLSGLRFTIAAKGRYDAEDEEIALAREQTHSYLEAGKQMLNLARRDSSTLSKNTAVMGKQSARATVMGTKLYTSAFGLAMMMGSPEYLWRWVQDSKARSASDLLALGVNIPETLRDAISKSTETKLLFDEERKIKQRLESAEGASVAMLHQQLEGLRDRMEEDELADAVLALREGRPTTLEVLHAAAQRDAEPASSGALLRTDTRVEKLGLHRQGPPRRVFFVDYGFYVGNSFIVVTDGDGLDFLWLNITPQQAARWKADWLTDRQPDPESPVSPGEATTKRYDPELRDGEDAALDWLSRLAQPLLPFSNPGDLLVLCPSETLHGIPIHAARVSADGAGETMSLIERNPVVYTASMTITEQWYVRSMSQTTTV
jgi:hypothetical protein